MQQELFNQSHEVEITPLVIYGMGSGHTHAHICMKTYPDESDFR